MPRACKHMVAKATIRQYSLIYNIKRQCIAFSVTASQPGSGKPELNTQPINSHATVLCILVRLSSFLECMHHAQL